MVNRIGRGCMKKKGDKIFYSGSFPDCILGEEIIIMKLDDLELMVKHDTNSLLSQQLEMDENDYSGFTDEILYAAPDMTSYKLFLDRHFYGSNPKDMVWVRYVSVDMSLMEED